MMSFIPLILSFLGSCRMCRIVLLAVLAATAMLGVLELEKHKAAAGARAAVIAEQEKATAAESVRRQAVVAASQAKAEVASARSITLEKRNASLKSELARASARVDSRGCLDADIVRRVRELGQPPGR